MRDWAVYVRERLTLLALTPEREARIVRELAAQLEDFYRDAIARGASEADADAYARGQIGDWDRFAQDVWLADRRHARPRMERLSDALDYNAISTQGGLIMMADVLRDARYAVRQLASTPAFTVVAVVTLAIGIGATSAIFSVVNGVLLRPLPYPQPESLVRVYEIVPQYGRFSVAPASFFDWRQQSTVFERIAAFNSTSVTYNGEGGPERLSGAAVSSDLFELLRVPPLLGRGFTPEDDKPGANGVIVLGFGMWQRRFGGDPAILGRTLTLNGRPTAIVGVMPSGFYFPTREAEFWTPIALNPVNATRGGHFLGVIARMRPDVSREQAEAEMKTIAERLALAYPDSSADESAEVVALHEQVVGSIRPALLTLLAAVAVVILIACANVANLLLARASVRERELAIRVALGAGRRRLLFQLLTESLVLSVAGGALGLLVAYLAIRPVQTLSAGSIPRVEDVGIDGTVLGFALLASVITGILFGLAPAWQATRGSLAHVLNDGRSASGSRGGWLRSGLLVAEVALSIVLLVGASLLLRSFARLTSVDPGFRADNVLAFRVALPPVSYPQPHHRAAFFDRLLERLDAVPSVSGAGIVQSLPMRGTYVLSFSIDGRPDRAPGEELSANYRVVSPGYFQALGIPLLRGRNFAEHDTDGSPLVAIVDDAFARRHFPDEDPIGRGIDIGNGTDGSVEIVGVVGSVHYGGLDANPNPTMYVPFEQDVFSTMWVVAKAETGASALSAAARQAVAEIDSGLPAFAMGPLTNAISDSVAQRRFSMLLLAAFAVVALFLAAVGLYGVVAYSVSQRTPEIGVRKAMGAQRAQVLRLIVGGGMKLAAIGAAVGVAAALALSQLIRSMLFEVTPFDPISYVATIVVLLVVAALACYVPARRAMRVDPVIALRQT